MSFPSLCSLIPGYKNGLHCMLSFLASLPHFSLAETTEIESARWLHPWLETHLRRNMGLSNLLDWERTWMQVSVTACVSSFTSRLACKGGWWPCLIRFCCPSASCLPGEAWSRCPLRRPGWLFLVYWLRMCQGSLQLPSRDVYTSLDYIQWLTLGLKITPMMFAFPFSFPLQYKIWMTAISALNLALITTHVCYKGLSSLKRSIFTLIPALGKSSRLFKLNMAIIAVWNISCFLEK